MEPALSEMEARLLRRVAEDSIRHGLERGEPLEVCPDDFPPPLTVEGAAFVTLNREGRLRGCVGSIVPRRTLVEDVARNAYGAAFLDPRFPSLRPEEMEGLDLHLSILSPMEPMAVTSREELLGLLRPGRDGLLLEDPPRRSTFLPQVWESLPDPEDFLAQLLLKAGLPPDHWSPTLTFHRYSVAEL